MKNNIVSPWAKFIGIISCLFFCLFALLILAAFSDKKGVCANNIALILIFVFGLCLWLEFHQQIKQYFKTIIMQWRQ